MLPRRLAVGVRVAPELAALLQPLLAADPGLVAADADAQVYVGAAPAGAPPRPAVVFQADAQDTFVFEGPGADREDVLISLAHDLALAEVDGAALAARLGRPITFGVREASLARLQIDPALLEPSLGFRDSRAFALLMAGALRRLAGVAPLVPFAAAGAPVPGVYEAHRRDDGPWEDPLGVAFTPTVGGLYVAPDGTPLAVASAGEASEPPPRGVAVLSAAGAVPITRMLAWIAFLLLAFEWVLVRRGRIP